MGVLEYWSDGVMGAAAAKPRLARRGYVLISHL
jgi:hypothetical protein